MLLFVGLFINFGFEIEDEGYVYKGFYRKIFVGDPALNLARILCAFLLHMQVLPEVRSAKEMLSFAKKNVTSFPNQQFSYPMLFAFFKMIGGVACFFANIFLCVVSKTIVDVVKDFVAVAIVSNIDNIIGRTLTSDDDVPSLRLFINRKRMRLTDIEIWNEFISPHGTTALSCADPKDLRRKDLKKAIESGFYVEPIEFSRKVHLALGLVLYRILSFLYHVIYFYFAPFSVSLVVIYARQGLQNYAQSTLPIYV